MTTVVNVNEPVVWETYGDIQILDCAPDQFAFVKDFVVENLMETNILFRTQDKSQMQNVMEDYLNFVDVLLMDRCSIIAMEMTTGKIIGALILKVMQEEQHSWTSIEMIPKTYLLKTIIHLYKYMLTQRNMAILKRTLHAFAFCVAKSHSGLNLKTKLFRSAYRIAVSMKLLAFSLVAFSINNQMRAIRSGMNEEYRCYYAHYLEKDGSRPFDVKQKREWFVILYVRPVEPTISYIHLPPI